MYTKYGGYNLTVEPHRPGPDNPPVNHPRFATVLDCKDRIRELQEQLNYEETVWAVRKLLQEQIHMMEGLIEQAWKKIKK